MHIWGKNLSSEFGDLFLNRREWTLIFFKWDGQTTNPVVAKFRVNPNYLVVFFISATPTVVAWVNFLGYFDLHQPAWPGDWWLPTGFWASWGWWWFWCWTSSGCIPRSGDGFWYWARRSVDEQWLCLPGAYQGWWSWETRSRGSADWSTKRQAKRAAKHWAYSWDTSCITQEGNGSTHC